MTKRATAADVVALERTAERVRTICVLAHVDHGKTSLSDTLIATNGVISERLSGHVRFLDFRADEQRRQITMKSAAIALVHRGARLVHLVDSPGHVDFSGEVSGAVRTTDGALLLVDSVEGVCIQTRVVLRQAWAERLRLVLVFTKVDKLVQIVAMSPAEAYAHLARLLEQVNAAVSALRHEDAVQAGKCEQDDVEEEEPYFNPTAGNVVFSCSLHHWAFRTGHFAHVYAERLGVQEDALRKALWGEFYIDPKTKRVFSKPKSTAASASQPLAVQLMFKPIWDVYNAVQARDVAKLEKIVAALKLEAVVNRKELASDDEAVAVTAVMSRWMPIGDGILDAVCEQLPSPVEAQRVRMPSLLRPLPVSIEALPQDFAASVKQLEESFASCNAAEDAPVLVFVVKMITLDGKEYSTALRRTVPGAVARATTAETASSAVAHTAAEGDEGQQHFVAIARVFSGVLRPGKQLYVLSPRFDPLDPAQGQHSTLTTVGHVFLLMGNSLEEVDCAPAGSICGIGGLGGVIAKTATLSSTLFCRPFAPMWNITNKPIVRVAVEPKNSADTLQLIRGMRMLNQADPMCQTLIQETGEQVVLAAGELHLERCLRDLRELYAKVDFNVSDPIVPLRETVVLPPAAASAAASPFGHSPVAEKSTANKVATVSVRAVPLPESVVELVEKSTRELAAICTQTGTQQQTAVDVAAEAFKAALKAAFTEAGPQWQEMFERIWSFGPHRVGPNMLFNNIAAYRDCWTPFLARAAHLEDVRSRNSAMEALMMKTIDGIQQQQQASEELVAEGLVRPQSSDGSAVTLAGLDGSIVMGFQTAVACGPLCAEPVRGVGFIVENFAIDTANAGENDTLGPMSGQVISAVSDACKAAMEACPMRLVEPLYLCEIQVESEMLGKMYAVLRRRRSKVLSEDIREGTSTFVVTAHLPVIESFGFSEEILKKTSGAAIPQLVFDRYAVLDIDPFFVPTTEEELEEFGEGSGGGIPPNIALQYIDMVRRRKGMATNEKLVEHADKQRTRSKKK